MTPLVMLPGVTTERLSSTCNALFAELSVLVVLCAHAGSFRFAESSQRRPATINPQFVSTHIDQPTSNSRSQRHSLIEQAPGTTTSSPYRNESAAAIQTVFTMAMTTASKGTPKIAPASAARSLGEGMEETLTVHRLGVPPKLRRSLASTNVIESAFSIVETVCRNVKRWRPGDQIERWVGSGLLVAERQFRKIRGFREIPLLLASLANTVSRKPVANEAAAA